jgi:Uncharacterized integral membrane protein
LASFERQSSLDFSQGNSAFVTYRKQNECKETIDNWHESELEKLSKLFLLCFHRYIYSKRAYQGNLLTVIQAPEPSDIIWENLTVSLTQKFCRRDFNSTNNNSIDRIIVFYSFRHETLPVYQI